MSLEAKNLTVGYRGQAVIKDINTSLDQNEFTVLIGANGSGKSTLIRTLVGAQSPLFGQILVDGVCLKDYSIGELARRLAVVLTDRTGAGGLRVRELVAIGRHPYSSFFGLLSDDDRKAVENALEVVQLSHKSECFVAQLSDGERQKAMIARAIAQETEIIILDEPTSFLDVASRFEIMDLLSTLAHRDGKAILLSTHDTAAAFPFADKLWVVRKGSLFSGTIDELSARGVLNDVFPGIVFDSAKQDFHP